MFDPVQDQPALSKHRSPRLAAEVLFIILLVSFALLWPQQAARGQQVGTTCTRVAAARTATCFAPIGWARAPYLYRFALQNLSPEDLYHVSAHAVDPHRPLLPISPDDLEIEGSGPLDRPVAPGAVTPMTTFRIDGPGARPGRDVCLRLSLHDAGLRERCPVIHCVTLPDCSPDPDALAVHGATKITSEADGVVLDGFGDEVGGVDVEIQGTDLFTTTWSAFDPLDGEGATIAVSTFGRAGGAVATVRAEGLGGTVDVSVHFHLPRQPGIVVDVLRPDGTLLLSRPARSDRGPVVTLDDWPIGLVAQTDLAGIVLLGPGDSYGIRLPDGSRVDGMVRFRPRGMLSVAPFSTSALRIQGLDSLHLDALSATADCDRDRVPDGEAILRGLVADDDGDGVPDRCRNRRSPSLP